VRLVRFVITDEWGCLHDSCLTCCKTAPTPPSAIRAPLVVVAVDPLRRVSTVNKPLSLNYALTIWSVTTWWLVYNCSKMQHLSLLRYTTVLTAFAMATQGWEYNEGIWDAGDRESRIKPLSYQTEEVSRWRRPPNAAWTRRGTGGSCDRCISISPVLYQTDVSALVLYYTRHMYQH
jgi:hypothetical protein